jgi:rRNA maturation endonuclease Nob1/tetratricopeptide (TPR) repeat protein
MSISAHAPLETEVPVFDVVVSMPTGATLESVEGLARQFGELPPAKIEGLIKALKNGPQVKIGSHIPKERADAAKAQFAKLGLSVTIVPQLSLQTKAEGEFDTRFLCRACNTRVELPQNRQCPSCGMFVDKITEEWLLKRKIMEQERAKLDSQFNRDDSEMKKRNQKSLEDAIRAKIREELEDEYGIKKDSGLFQGKKGMLRAGGLVGLLAIAFAGGNIVSLGGFSFGKSGAAAASTNDPAKNDVDQLLNSVGAPGAAGGTAQSASATGDPDIDDPMIQELTGGKKMGGAGLTMEQAIAASKALAGAVGNHTADQAMAGTLPTGANTGSAPVADSAGGAAEPVVAVPPLTKQILAADFANQLAEIGQARRAREVIKAVKPLAAEPAAVAAIQNSELQVQAWAMQPLGVAQARQALDTLIADSKLIADGAERSRVLSQTGVIVSQQPQLPSEAARALLTLAAESLKSVTDAKRRSAAMGDWMVAMGQVLLNEASTHAKAGRMTKAQGLVEQLKGLIKDAPDAASQARLHAINYQIQVRMGQGKTASQSLETAMELLPKTPNLVERATLLHSVAQLAGSASTAAIQSAVGTLRSQLDAKAVMNREQALAQLSLMHRDFGLHDKADEYSRLAQTSKGLTPTEASSFISELIVRGDLASAKLLHKAGQYAESEAVLHRVSGYLF